MENNELYHHGIKGQKWGRRRFQNKDGTLTPAGKKRYERDAMEKGYKNFDEGSGVYYKKNKKGRENLEFDPDRYYKEDLTRTRSLTNEASTMVNKLKNVNDKAIKNTPKPKMDLSNMTEKEMRDQINRAILERQYNEMFAPPTVSKGREMVSSVLENAGDVLAITGSALGIALAIKELRG